MSARPGRRAGIVATVAVLAVGLAGAGVAALRRPVSAPPAPQVSTGTAPVTRGAVAERLRFTGSLGFDGSYAVRHQAGPGCHGAVVVALAHDDPLGSDLSGGGPGDERADGSTAAHRTVSHPLVRAGLGAVVDGQLALM